MHDMRSLVCLSKAHTFQLIKYSVLFEFISINKSFVMFKSMFF